MASPTHSSYSRRRTAYSSRSRRSSANGAQRLKAAQKPRLLVLLAVGALVLALAAAIGTIAFHLMIGADK